MSSRDLKRGKEDTQAAAGSGSAKKVGRPRKERATHLVDSIRCSCSVEMPFKALEKRMAERNKDQKDICFCRLMSISGQGMFRVTSSERCKLEARFDGRGTWQTHSFSKFKRSRKAVLNSEVG